jgi:glycosyltransferase involved in cell wall biosynthesis
VYRYFKKKEIEFFSEADYTISLTHNGKKVIHSWEKVKGQPIPIQVIPCCVDTELFNPVHYPEKSEARNLLHLPQDSLVLTYLGSIGTWYMLPEMMAFFKELKQIKPQAKMLFITGEKPAQIHTEADKYDLSPQDFVIIKAKREEVPKYLMASDLSIFFIKPVFSKKASSPTKQGEIMAMGIPIICNTDVGDTDYVLKMYEAGILINEFDAPAYQQAIGQIEAVLASDRAQLRKGAKEFYGLEEGIKRYASVYKAVMEGV